MEPEQHLMNLETHQSCTTTALFPDSLLLTCSMCHRPNIEPGSLLYAFLCFASSA